MATHLFEETLELAVGQFPVQYAPPEPMTSTTHNYTELIQGRKES